MKHGFALLLVAAAWSNLTVAGGETRHSFRDYAPVVDVQPIVSTSYEPVTERICAEPDLAAENPNAIAPSIGEDIRRQIRRARLHPTCRIVEHERVREQITGYWVTYRYRGHLSRARLAYDPGERIAVDIRLSPLP